MKKYVINEISTDGYERFAVIQRSGQDVELNVHFLEYDEFLEKGDIASAGEYVENLPANRNVSDLLWLYFRTATP